MKNKIPVIVCIGTSKVSGDSLGAKVGDILTETYPIKAHIYGTSARNVNGVNLNSYLTFIREKHQNSLVIAVDACVGTDKDIGKIIVTAKGIKAGGALGKNFEKIGDIGILGVVCEKGIDNFKNLMLVSESLVNIIAQKIAIKIVSLLFSLNLQ